jgi:hypothetical protein
MSCQSESEGSSDGTGQGEAGERGAAEEASVSVEGITNLVSGPLSECVYVGNLEYIVK